MAVLLFVYVRWWLWWVVERRVVVVPLGAGRQAARRVEGERSVQG